MRVRSLIMLVAIILVIGYGVQSIAGTTMGGSFEKDFTDDTVWYGGYLRTGGLLQLELGGCKPYSGSSSEIKLFSYILLNLNLGTIGVNTGSLDFYLGASPDMTLETSSPSFSVSDSSAYGKMGLQLNIFPISVQVQTKGRFDFSGDITNLLTGVGLGLSF